MHVPPAKGFTLSISENSIRSSSVQLRPIGEMLSIPFLNSMNVPLQADKDGWLTNVLIVKRLTWGKTPDRVWHNSELKTSFKNEEETRKKRNVTKCISALF